MKLKTLVIILITTFSCTIHICAQPQSAKQSYNFTRALEEAQKGNKSEAMDFLTKEIAENPVNGNDWRLPYQQIWRSPKSRNPT